MVANRAMISAGDVVFTVLTRCLVGPLLGVETSNLYRCADDLDDRSLFPPKQLRVRRRPYAGMTQARHRNFYDSTEAGVTDVGLCSRGC